MTARGPRCSRCGHKAHTERCTRQGRIECRRVGSSLVRGTWPCGCEHNGEDQAVTDQAEDVTQSPSLPKPPPMSGDVATLQRQVANGRQVIYALVQAAGGVVVLPRPQLDNPGELLIAQTPDGLGVWCVQGSDSCRSCHAPIVWATGDPTDRKPEGSRVPVNIATVGQPGKVAIRRDEHGALCSRGITKARPEPDDGEQWATSHYATCPNRDQWRGTTRR